MRIIYKKTALALVLLTFILSACNPGSYKPLLKSRYDKITDTLQGVKVINSQSPASDVYRIKPRDILSVTNTKQLIESIEGGGGQASGGQSSSQSSGSSSGFRVEEDGTINLPIVGSVYVMNLSRKEAQDKIQELYKSDLLRNPLITVSIVNPTITIIGQVSAPGNYPLPNENTPLIQGIGMAGGFTPQVDPKSLKIVRGTEIIYANLENLSTLGNPKLILQNNDIIYVGTDKRFSKYERSQSGFGIFQSIILVLSTGLLIFTSFFK